MKRMMKLAAVTAMVVGGMCGDALGGNGAAPVEWKGRDIGGAQVALPPATAQPMVVLFVMPEQERTKDALSQAGGVLGSNAAARALVVVSGKGAAEQAQKLKAGGCAWPIVSDADYELSAKLNVHVWPTAVVLDGRGQVVGHLAGLPKHFSMHLETYVAFAAGKIEKGELERRLGSPELILDDPQQMASRHLTIAQRLLDKGLPDQARVELNKALGLSPGAPGMQLAVARVLLTLGGAADVAEAVKVLDAMDAGKAPPSELNLLRGRALSLQGKAPEAQRMLEQAIKLNPQPAEAWYELGMVLEKQGETAKAAHAYRKAFESTEMGRKLRPASSGVK